MRLPLARSLNWKALRGPLIAQANFSDTPVRTILGRPTALSGLPAAASADTNPLICSLCQQNNCVSAHSFLDKNLNSVYLTVVEFFCTEMSESAEQEPFPSSKDVAALCSGLAQSRTVRMPMRRVLKGYRTRLG